MIRRAVGSAALLLSVAGCTKAPQALPDQTAPVSARVIPIQSGSYSTGTSLTGSVVSRQSADLAAQVMAPVAEVRVHEGQMVQKGQVVIRLSSATLAAGVQQAGAQLAAAQKQASAAAAQSNLAAQTYARYDMLNQRHSITPHEFDQVKAQLEQAQAQQQAAQAQVMAAQAAQTQSSATAAYTIIRAPFSGVITAKYVDPGAMASPGVPLLRMENPRSLELDVQVNQSSLARLHVGEPVAVELDGASSPTEAKVLEVVPSGDPAAHTFTVKIGLNASSGVYPGMTGNVQIPGAAVNAITVPRSAIRQRGQLDAVLALDRQSVAQLRYVSLGRVLGDNQVEVLSGLSAGDHILADPGDAMIGRRIEPRP